MRYRVLLALALGLPSVALPATASAQWVTAATDTLAGTAASERSTRFSVAVDAADAPHAIWSSGSSLVYSRTQAGTWIPPITLSLADANYSGHAVAVVPGTTRPCVLYSRTPFGAPAGELLIAEWNGIAFDVRVLTADGVAKFGPALALDASGAYHVVFVVQDAGEWRLRYLTNVTGASTDTLLTVGPLGAFGSGATPAIAVEAGGTAHVVYRGAVAGYRIHHAQNSTPGGANWSWQELVSPNAEDSGSDIKVDAAGNVHVAASGADCDICTRRTHVFERLAGGAWGTPVPIVHANGLAGPSLALDAGGGVHVVMPEISGSLLTGRLVYASSRTAWSPSLVVGNDHGTPSLAVDAQRRGHLVCTTGPNTGVRNVLYLRSLSATSGVNDEMAPAASTWRALPNPFRQRTVLRLAGGSGTAAIPTAGATAIVYDLAGRIVRHLPPTPASGGGVEYAWDGQSDHGRDLAAGVYRIAADGGSRGGSSRARAMAVVKLR